MNRILSVLGTWKFWKELLIMSLGMFIAAAAVYYFLVPSKIVVGSISGLSMVLTGVLAKLGVEVKVSLVIFIINALLLVLAYFLIGAEFGIKTVYTALILGPMMELWNAIYPVERFFTEPGQTSVMNDPWFDLICFVLVLSASQAVLFRINASTGGLDILAKIVNKYLHFDIGVSVSVAGAIICCTAFAINPFRLVIIGLIGTWINGLVVDHFTASLNKRKRVCVVSDQYDEVRSFIVNNLVRGCTLYPCKGGYSGEDKMEVQALLTQDEFSDLMKYISDNEISSFITAGNVSEVYGLWFTDRKRRNKKKEKQITN